jgi:acetyl-CoA synthetase (ADP-forming)
MFYSEKETEEFLEKNRYSVAKRAFVYERSFLENALNDFKFPIVMKVCGKKIVHKNKLGGILLGIFNFESALKSFEKLKKITHAEGVIIQEQIVGKEILIGIKKTSDFGHSICVGSGGIHTEELKDLSFRIFPFDEREAEKMISETKISKKLNKKEKNLIKEVLMNSCSLIKNNPQIFELDINPLIVNDKKAVVVDARMVLEE